MKAIIIGVSSDIGLNLARNLKFDGWEIYGTYRTWRDELKEFDNPISGYRNFCQHDLGSQLYHEFPKWDLLLICTGQLTQGRFYDYPQWTKSLLINCVYPLDLIKELRPLANPNFKVGVLGGNNPNHPNPDYSSYSAAKVALWKAMEEIAVEDPNGKYFVLSPGYVHTRMTDHLHRGCGTTHDQIYALLSEAMEGESGWNYHINGSMYKLRGV